jgi:hypothetical protein
VRSKPFNRVQEIDMSKPSTESSSFRKGFDHEFAGLVFAAMFAWTIAAICVVNTAMAG